MIQRTLRIPGTLTHTSDEQTDATLQEKARAHADRHPGLLFLADLLRLLHGSVAPLRNAKMFYSAFPPREVMDAFAHRPDLRVKPVRAITGSPATLLRRMSSEALASQIELLAIEDLPDVERSVRAESDRALSLPDLYLKYLDAIDIATYLPAQSIWKYESHDSWWKKEPTPGARALMAAELRSVRQHAILTDSEILDLLGDETLELHLSLAVRTGLRGLARRAASAGRPFTDSDLFAGVQAMGDASGGRDLIDEMVENVPLPQLRDVIVHAIRVLGLSDVDENDEPTVVTIATSARNAAAVPTTPLLGQRVGPKPTPAVAAAPSPAIGKPRPPVDRGATPPARPMPQAPGVTPMPGVPSLPAAKGGRAAPLPPLEAEGPPLPDDDLIAILDDVSGRI